MPRRVWGAGDAPDPWALTYRRTTKEKLLVARPPAIVAEIVPVSRFPILPAGATSAHTALTPTWLPRGWSVSPPTLAVQVMRTERAFVETGALIENAFPAWMPARATGAPRVTVGEGGGADVVVVVVVVPVASVYVYQPVSGAKSQKFTFGGSRLMLMTTKLNADVLPMSALLNLNSVTFEAAAPTTKSAGLAAANL